jgi:hypothetical protein
MVGAQRHQFGANLLYRRQEMTAAVFGLNLDAARLGLAQQIGEFLTQQGRVGGDKNDAGQRSAELNQHPIRTVRRANSHVPAPTHANRRVPSQSPLRQDDRRGGGRLRSRLTRDTI